VSASASSASERGVMHISHLLFFDQLLDAPEFKADPEASTLFDFGSINQPDMQFYDDYLHPRDSPPPSPASPPTSPPPSPPPSPSSLPPDT
jgi:hypothetical protein